MTNMESIGKKIIIPCLLIAFSAVAGIFSADAAVKGEKNVGLQTGYTSFNKSAIAGINFSYAFSSHFRFSPNLQYAFRNHNSDGLLINFDCHVPLNIESGDKVEVYPILGLNYSCWTKYHEGEDVTEGNDVSTRKNRFGLNAGAGVGYNVAGSLRLTLDARYSLVKDYGTTTIAVGIAYRF